MPPTSAAMSLISAQDSSANAARIRLGTGRGKRERASSTCQTLSALPRCLPASLTRCSNKRVYTLGLRHQPLYRTHFPVARQPLNGINKTTRVTACETFKRSGELGVPLGLPRGNKLADLIDVKIWNLKIVVESPYHQPLPAEQSGSSQ